jgi:hypothetical protein
MINELLFHAYGITRFPKKKNSTLISSNVS